MKHEKQLKSKSKKKYEVVWTCDYCKKEFKTKKESDKHELDCPQNPVNKNKKTEKIVTTIFIVFFCFYLLTYFAINSYAKTNGFKSKSLFSPSEWFVNETISEANQENPKTELQNVKYDGKIISGTIVNKSDKAIFNTKVILKISKDRTTWNIDETHEFTVSYKIEANQSINFSENHKTTKKDPWWTTEILESHFYNGEEVSIPTPTPTTKPETVNIVKNDANIDCIGPDGVHFQTTQAKCDEFNNAWGNTNSSSTNSNNSTNSRNILTNSGILNYINQYRQKNGHQPFSRSDELCRLAEERVSYLIADRLNAYRSSEAGNHTGLSSIVDKYSGGGIGENIGANIPPGFKDNPYADYSGYLNQYTTNQDAGAVSQWIHSPPHNALLLSDEREGTKLTKACVAHRIVEDYAILTVLLVGDK